VLPGPAGKLQELAAAGALQQVTPEALGLKAHGIAGTSPSQAAHQYDVAFLSSSWSAAKARAEEDEVLAGGLFHNSLAGQQTQPHQHTVHAILHQHLICIAC
jgi:hypothetical protein